MTVRFIALFSVIFASVSASAQTHVKPEDLKRDSLTRNAPESHQPLLDLRGAIRSALDNNNDLKNKRAKVEQLKWDKATTRAMIFPNLSLEGTAQEKKDAVGGTGSALFDGKAYNLYGADLKLVQPLFAYGSLSAIRGADYTIKMSEIDLEIAERDLTRNVIETFYKVLLNQRLVEILERQLGVVNESLATANSRLRTGRGQLLDVLTVKTEIALLKPQIEDAHNQLESAGANLATLLAETGKYELKLKGALRGLIFEELQKRMHLKESRLPELERVRMAREQLAELKDVSFGKHMPNLQLLGDYGATSYTKADLTSGSTRDWSLMLKLTIPLFSGFQSIDERRSFVEQDRQFEFQGRDMENTLAFNQVQSLKALQSAGASLVSAEEAAKLSDQSMVEVRKQYRLGTIDFIQFLTVEKNALDAYKALDTIKFNNIVAYSKYFVATGQPLSILVEALQEPK